MTTFDDRKDAYENKYAHDKEMEFKITARRNKLLGLWAADKLHLQADERDAYARAIATDVEHAAESDIIHRVLHDFEGAGVQLTEKDIRAEMHRLLEVAREQVANG